MRVLHRMKSKKKRRSPISPASVTTDNIGFKIPLICFTCIKIVLFTLKVQDELEKDEELRNNVCSFALNFQNLTMICQRAASRLTRCWARRKSVLLLFPDRGCDPYQIEIQIVHELHEICSTKWMNVYAVLVALTHPLSFTLSLSLSVGFFLSICP